MRCAVTVGALAMMLAMAAADVLPPGSKGVSHALLFEGVDAHPGMTFVLWPASHSPDASGSRALIVRPGESVSFYKLSRPKLYAVPGAPAVESLTDAYFEAHPELAVSAEGFSIISSVPSSDATASIRTAYRILGVSGGRVDVDAGTELRLDAAGLPVGAARGWNLWILGLGGLGVLAVILKSVRRRTPMSA